MPRKSAAELAEVPHLADHYRRITAPDGMTPEETALFRKIVEDCHPLHFAQADAPLLRAYVQACVLGELAFVSAQQSPDALGDWERYVRVQAALSVKLRLNPHSRADPKTVMRTVAGHSVREVGVSLESLAAIRDGTSGRGWTCRG
jgi:hypothetical protein